MPDPLAARAAAILRRIAYVAIATVDAEGAWVAPVHHRLLRGGSLYFESDHSSRHSRAIAASGRVAATVFDSGAAPADADGVQFEGAARVVPADRDAVLAVLGRRRAPLADAAAEADGILALPRKRLHVVDLERVYVFDRDAWRATGTDARLEVDLTEAIAALDAG